ncbi:MarR family winged helix-turn-helix transcriptional regulator [Capnocytophaga sp. oral taxon 864]|jgi:Transcriptional regulators|uniref:MarR family winged helix-turn-helix transcriptional regulator n=1 Tax=Capnocytophaga sp. oral taxon 864 TaxID=1316593 RepID=UPI000D029D5E|nr:MarR family transcriptional regulator [Capnocytophaga sp. oral taxon 864]AVM55243.1 MarR family transcriptional regulator [Capnocytophaga sp. oral taxon 864]
MTKDALKLSSQVCFPLYAASREITQQYAKYLMPLDLTYPQYLVLLVLWEEKNLSVNAIGEKLYLDSGTLTPLLKRMEAKELLTRTRSAQDERTVLINLTEKGKKLQTKAKKIPIQLKEETPLSEEELETLKTLVNKLLNHK